MKVALLTVPGKFPTLLHDPGVLWSTASRHPGAEVTRLSANFEWWRLLCGATPAGDALEAFRSPEVFSSRRRYFAAVAELTGFLAAYNAGQTELSVDLFRGPAVRGLNYDDSGALAEYARRDTALSRGVAAALDRLDLSADVFLFSVTFPQDLLTAMVAARLIRERRGADPYLCLADHGYENFSLHVHAPALEDSGHLAGFFDGIVLSKQERRTVLAHVLERLSAGVRLEGFLHAEGLGLPKDAGFAAYPYVPSPPLETFAPKPVLWTRVSERRCYWSRCSFCVQNAKYDNPQPPSLGEVEGSLDKLSALAAAGYEYLVFSDEALSPSVLKALSEGILRRGLKLKWSCRCRIETSFTPEILARMREAGCYEILFGLESASARMLKLMEKHDKGLDLDAVRALWRRCDAAGIGVHITMIAGFPGDTPEDSALTADFVSEALRGVRHATFKLNYFSLFPDTPVFNAPERFGVLLGEGGGDMPMSYPYALTPELAAPMRAVEDLYPDLVERLYGRLGWTEFLRRHGGGEAVDKALHLYFHTGHGTFFKTDAREVFGDPSAPASGAA
ncbi:radical SAM protein [bacterium]|nr:MAG: radical SAM protein [bacterium]